MSGYEKLDCGGGYSVITVFSASNYDGAGNDACFLKLTVDASKTVSQPTPCVYHSSHHTSVDATKEKNRKSLIDLLVKNRPSLQEEFSKSYPDGKVHPAQWGELLGRVLHLESLAWNNLQPMLAPVEADGLIEWAGFWDSYQVSRLGSTGGGGGGSEGAGGRRDSKKMAKLYGNHRTLVMMFDYFDSDGDGKAE